MTKMLLGKEIQAGDTLEVVADCVAFERDVRAWYANTKRVLVFLRHEGSGVKRCKVQI
jgi:TusA-related sulfurtransferase